MNTNPKFSSIAELKAEALRRMQSISLKQEYIDGFSKEPCEIYCFENGGVEVRLIGEKEDALIAELEKDKTKLCWAVLHEQYEEDGQDWDHYGLLYVSNNQSEWEEKGSLLVDHNMAECVDLVAPQYVDSVPDWGEPHFLDIEVVNGNLTPSFVVFEVTILEDGDIYESSDFDNVHLQISNTGFLSISRCFTSISEGLPCIEEIKKVPFRQLSCALGTEGYEETVNEMRKSFSFGDNTYRVGFTFFHPMISFLREHGIPYEYYHDKMPFPDLSE